MVSSRETRYHSSCVCPRVAVMSKDGTSEEVAATGGVGVTEAQLASIGEVVQGLLDKALHKDRSAGGDRGGPSRGTSDGETGELEAGPLATTMHTYNRHTCTCV